MRLSEERRELRLIVTCHHHHFIDTHFAQDAQTPKKQRLSLNLNRPLCTTAQSRALSGRKQDCANAQSPGLAVAGLAAGVLCHSRSSFISSSSIWSLIMRDSRSARVHPPSQLNERNTRP
jgi:hypothetical protein